MSTPAEKVAAAVAATSAAASTVKAEYGFVRANWGKLSAIVIAAALIGAFVGHVL